MKSNFDKPYVPTSLDYVKLDNTPVDHVQAIVELDDIIQETKKLIFSLPEKKMLMYKFSKAASVKRDQTKFIYEPIFAVILCERYNYSEEKSADLMLAGKALEKCYELFKKEKSMMDTEKGTIH